MHRIHHRRRLLRLPLPLFLPLFPLFLHPSAHFPSRNPTPSDRTPPFAAIPPSLRALGPPAPSISPPKPPHTPGSTTSPLAAIHSPRESYLQGRQTLGVAQRAVRTGVEEEFHAGGVTDGGGDVQRGLAVDVLNVEQFWESAGELE